MRCIEIASGASKLKKKNLTQSKKWKHFPFAFKVKVMLCEMYCLTGKAKLKSNGEVFGAPLSV